MVHIAQRYLAAVRHDGGTIATIYGYKQRIEYIDPAVVVHVAQQPTRHPLCQRDAGYDFDLDIHRSSDRLHPKTWIHVGHQPRPRYGQSIDGGRLYSFRDHDSRTTRSRSNRDTHLPVDQHHATGQMLPAGGQPVEIDSCAHRTLRRVRGTPTRRVKTG